MATAKQTQAAKRNVKKGWASGSRSQLGLAGHDLVDVPVRPAEVLPGRTGLAEQLDTGEPQLVHGRGQVADGESDHRAGGEVILARVVRAKHLDVAPVGKLEDPEARLRVHRLQAKHAGVEVRQLFVMVGAGPAPSQARDVHAASMSVLPHPVGGWREDCAVRVVGVDAWRGGWVAVVLEDGQVSDVRLAVTLDRIIDECPDAAAVGVDMPLGLVERGWRGGRRLGGGGGGGARP